MDKLELSYWFHRYSNKDREVLGAFGKTLNKLGLIHYV